MVGDASPNEPKYGESYENYLSDPPELREIAGVDVRQEPLLWGFCRGFYAPCTFVTYIKE